MSQYRITLANTDSGWWACGVCVTVSRLNTRRSCPQTVLPQHAILNAQKRFFIAYGYSW